MQQDANDGLSNLDHAFAAALEHQRTLAQNTASFLRGESFRFITLRLDRTRGVMGQLSECRNLPGLMQVQKEWLGDLVQDYAAQGQRVSELWQQQAGRVRTEMERQAETAHQAAQAMMDETHGSAEAAADAAHEAVYGASEEAAGNFSEAQDAMAPVHQQPNDPVH